MCRVVADSDRGLGLGRGEELKGEIENMSAEKTTRRPVKKIVATIAPLAALAFAIPALAIAVPGPASLDTPEARMTQAPTGIGSGPMKPQMTQAPTGVGSGPMKPQMTQAPTVVSPGQAK